MKTRLPLKSIGLYGKKPMQLELRTNIIESPAYDEVIVQIRACGICGTDLNFLKHWEGDALPLGHEIAGEIIEVGRGVSGIKQGDKVIVEDCSMCGRCQDCKNAQPDLCLNMYTINGQPGLGQYMKINQNSIIRFSDMDFISACLVEPLSVSLNAVIKADIPCNATVMVLGCGPLGIMSAILARHQGARFVAISDIDTNNASGKARINLAKELQFDMVLDSSKIDIEREIKSKIPKGVDRVIVSSPPESICDALKVINYGGTIAFFGLHLGGRNIIKIDINELIFQKITLRPVFAEPAINFNLSINLIKDKVIPVNKIVTHQVKFNELKNIFNYMINGTEPIVKAVMVQ